MADMYGNRPRNAFGGTNDTGLNQLQALAEIATALGGQRTPTGAAPGADVQRMRPPRGASPPGPASSDVFTGADQYGPMSEGPIPQSESGPVDSSVGLAATALQKGGPYIIGEDPARDEAARMLLDRMGIQYRSLADGFNQLEAKVFGRAIDSFSEGSEVDPTIIERLVGGW